MAGNFQVSGRNAAALFTLRVHRGDGMALLAMNWKEDKPPDDFVGFAIQYREPGGTRFFSLTNRLSFPGADAATDADIRSSLRSPIQKFRWVHFPRHAEIPGEFTYRVTPVFMNKDDKLSYGEPQTVEIELRRETYPDQLNVGFTRGFVASQAFVDRFSTKGDPISTLLPARAADGLRFEPTHPRAVEALGWMGFEARSVILEVLDQAIAHRDAKVLVVAYDLSEPGLVGRLEKLGKRLRIVVDDAADHGEEGSGETQSAERLVKSAGADQVRRQHMGGLQHNKTIVVTGAGLHRVVCGSTNFSWRGFYVQNNSAVVLQGEKAVRPFLTAFEQYWASNSAKKFGVSPAAEWADLGLDKIDAKVAFSPHGPANQLLATIGADIEHTTSSLFYSLAFLAQTEGPIRNAVKKVTEDAGIFVFGMADKEVGGIEMRTPDGNLAPVSPAALGKSAPEPFKSEPTGGFGIRMHHKFVVIDFDKPTARVYVGSYNFSPAADTGNGENLLLIRDRRIAVSYMVEAVRIFDHYQFRLKQKDAKKARKALALAKPPRAPGEAPWWTKDYTDPPRIRDRLLFA